MYIHIHVIHSTVLYYTIHIYILIHTYFIHHIHIYIAIENEKERLKIEYNYKDELHLQKQHSYEKDISTYEFRVSELKLAVENEKTRFSELINKHENELNTLQIQYKESLHNKETEYKSLLLIEKEHYTQDILKYDKQIELIKMQLITSEHTIEDLKKALEGIYRYMNVYMYILALYTQEYMHSLCMHVYVCCMHMCIFVYVYIIVVYMFIIMRMHYIWVCAICMCINVYTCMKQSILNLHTHILIILTPISPPTPCTQLKRTGFASMRSARTR